MRRTTVGFTGTLALIAVVVVTLVSPVLLVVAAAVLHVDWPQLSEIGQAYGFASAALSGLAFLAVAYSLVLQQREVHATRLEAHRQVHMNLLQMSIDDPDLLDVLFPTAAAGEVADRRRHLYANLLVQFWQNQFATLGTIRAPEVEQNAKELFAGPHGRDYWRHVRTFALGSWSTRTTREKEFVRILEAAYQQAISTDPADAAPAEASPDPADHAL